jgi:hypothetical protein
MVADHRPAAFAGGAHQDLHAVWRHTAVLAEYRRIGGDGGGDFVVGAALRASGNALATQRLLDLCAGQGSQVGREGARTVR